MYYELKKRCFYLINTWFIPRVTYFVLESRVAATVECYLYWSSFSYCFRAGYASMFGVNLLQTKSNFSRYLPAVKGDADQN